MKTEYLSATINIQKLRELINRGYIFYVPDKDTLIISKASKLLKPILDEFGY